MKHFKIGFKKYFVTGLAAILPLWLSLLVISLIFKWISNLATPFFAPLFYYAFDMAKGSFLVRAVSFLLTILTIWTVGFVVTHILGRGFLHAIEALVLKVPGLSPIYGSIRKLIQFVFSRKRDFKSVVMVEFPRAGIYSVGFVTGSSVFPQSLGEFVNVFIPTTPNPTTGFLVFAREQEVTQLDISVDEAVRLIISGGIIVPQSKERPSSPVQNGSLSGGSSAPVAVNE